jgi:hypothetical protein
MQGIKGVDKRRIEEDVKRINQYDWLSKYK